MYIDPDICEDINALRRLNDMGYFRRSAYGIALREIHEGTEALSRKQNYVLATEVSPVTYKICAMCDEAIPLPDLPDAYEEDLMLCGYHRRQWHNDN